MKVKHTSAMLQELKQDGTFAKYVDKNETNFIRTDFTEYLGRLSRDKGIPPVQIIRNAQIDRVYGHQLFNGIRKPSRDKVLQLAFGLGCSLEETQKMLRLADRSSLYPKIKRDAAIIYGLNNRVQISELQELLFSMELPVLGGEV